MKISDEGKEESLIEFFETDPTGGFDHCMSREDKEISFEVGEDEWEKIYSEMTESTNTASEFEPQCLLEYIREYTPFDVFQKFFTSELVENIVNETNLYFKQSCEEKKQLGKFSRMHRWKDVEKEDIYAFIGVLLLAGINKRESILDHFSLDPFLRSPVADILNRNQFQLLTRYIHLYDNSKIVNKTEKITYFISYLTKRWRKALLPGQKIVIDETMADFKGKSHLVQYMPKKPVKFGIKSWTLADSKLGYMINLEMYEGKNSKKNIEDIIVNFVSEYRNKNYILYMDSFFSNPKLFNRLLTYGVDSIGIVKTNRKGIMKDLDKVDLGMNESVFYRKNDLLLLRWKDKKYVNLLSTIRNTQIAIVNGYDKVENRTAQKCKPLLLIDYSYSMKGVDKNNQLSSYSSYEYRQRKWWWVMFIKLLEISIVNSYILYKHFGAHDLTQKQFRIELIRFLIKFSNFKKIFPAQINAREYFLEKDKTGNCKNCYKNKLRTQTNLYCRICFRTIQKPHWSCCKCHVKHLEIFHL